MILKNRLKMLKKWRSRLLNGKEHILIINSQSRGTANYSLFNDLPSNVVFYWADNLNAFMRGDNAAT